MSFFSHWVSSGRRRVHDSIKLGVDYDERGNVARDDRYMSSVPGVFVAGDDARPRPLPRGVVVEWTP